MPERVVITGLGLCSSLGHNADQVLDAFARERTNFVLSLHLPLAVCPVDSLGDDAAALRLLRWRHRRYLSRGARLAVLAGLRAVENAGFEAVPEDMGLVGTAAPTLDFQEEPGLPPDDPLKLDALWLLRWLPNTPVSALALLLGAHGEGLSVGSACASGLAALGEAWFRIRHGALNTALVVCGDSRLSLGGLLGYAKAHTVSRCQQPERAARPFDRERDGFVPGEGGAAFVLESRSSALARRARILGEILGYGASLDGSSLTAPDPEGRYAERAVRRALDEAGMQPSGIAWVSAHGTGTRANDSAEAAILLRLFGTGPSGPAVTALKSWAGHCLSAAGGLETALCLIAVSCGMLPCVRGLMHPEADLNFVRGTLRKADLAGSAGLVSSFGFGGQNSALVLRAGAGA